MSVSIVIDDKFLFEPIVCAEMEEIADVISSGEKCPVQSLIIEM